ncbi:polar amino acid transport system permease protein [Enhydrobacter aerosaccus]|uniref:Polar amino acid transport system permease protein n=1 Tax=Enhydrobacter aerosaccus TaxID=225324 RepID=A0A1T4PB33_9HYPH|nr:amino acid ABC transporter permease [Enhydrobacter aerosaccus]SJZ88689.1 polar amino acid transport system permease protein [Enhydrobacter aerosaccus]
MKGFDVADFLNALGNPFLLVGALVTAGLTVAGLGGGFACGLLVALLRSAPSVIAQRLAGGYIWFFRGTPLLIQMVMIYSGLPQVGVRFGVLGSVLVALIANEAAYMAEIIRGGFLAVPSGQSDAAKALGLSRRQTLVLVTLPQAARIIIPAIGNSVNGLLKATSIASVISMEELMRRSEMIMQIKFDVLEVFAAAAIYYLILTSLWDQAQRWLERRFNRAYRAGPSAIAPAIEQAVLPR